MYFGFLLWLSKSSDEDEIEHLQHAVTASCFLDVGPSQVRHLWTLLIQVKGVFLEWHQGRGGF